MELFGSEWFAPTSVRGTLDTMPKRVDRDLIHAELRKRFGSTITRSQMEEYRRETGKFPGWFYTQPFQGQHQIGRGLFRIPGAGEVTVSSAPSVRAPRDTKAKSKLEVADTVADVIDVIETDTAPVTSNLTSEFFQNATIAERIDAITNAASALAKVPARDPRFVPFGEYEIVRRIIAAGRYRATFITGLSGNGKTFQIAQACATENREYIRVNITAETDEDDLLGGFRLQNGNTVFELGPVVVAMLRGAVLTLDEVDLASSKIMCLQPVLEGNPVVIKKLGVTIHPAPGFCVFATANTKGRGSDDGRFVGANLQNEAFLDRFHGTIEQEYPGVAVEKKILRKTFEAEGYKLTPHAVTFFDTLCRWAEQIRITFAEGGVEDLIATRRLVHIVQMYGTFDGDEQQALMFCVNRFEPKTKDAFIDLYNKLAPDAVSPSNVGTLD